ncbi:MAG: hypothetical protein ACTSXA_04625 [Candidatus Heimdallarchaeota archaeon]
MEEKLPLFLTLYDPLAIYVINNEIIGSESIEEKVNPAIVMKSYDLGHGYTTPGHAFLFLKKMFQNENLRKFFPEELHQHFEPFIGKELSEYNHSVIQRISYSDKQHRLYFDLIIDDTNEYQPIILHNFSYEGILLDYTVKLSPKEAFFTFANICANALSRKVLNLSNVSFNKLLHREIVRPNEFLQMQDISSFVVDYFKYLRDNFEKNTLDPYFILRTSGARLLMCLSQDKQITSFVKQISTEILSDSDLSIEKKIMYYTLLKLLSAYSNRNKLWGKSFEKIAQKLEQYRQELQYHFPEDSILAKSTLLDQEEFTKTFMPIFWFQEQPIEIYVINNKILGAYTGSGSFNNGSSSKAFHLLNKLFNNPHTKKDLPESLGLYFKESKVQDIKPASSLYAYLLGWHDPHMRSEFLNIDIEIQKAQEKSVLLKDFTFNNMPMDLQIPLTSREAFILLANICTSKMTDHFYGIVSDDDFDWNSYRFSEDFEKELWLKEFVLAYLKFIRKQIVMEKITPLELLRLSGAPVLALLIKGTEVVKKFLFQILVELKKLEELSFNRQIMYFTLLEIWKDKFSYDNKETKIFDLINDFYRDNYAIIHTIKNRIDKQYPRNDRQLLDWLLSFEDVTEIPKEEFVIQPKEQEDTPIEVFFFFSKFHLMVKENELVLFKQQTTHGFGIKSFKLLRELYNSKNIRKAIPEIFHYSLDGLGQLFGDDMTGACFSGTKMFDTGLCLDFSLVIDEKANTVILEDIEFENEPLCQSIKLASEDAFLIFSNSLFYHNYNGLANAMRQLEMEKFDKEVLLKRINEQSEESEKQFGKKHWLSAANIYLVEYLAFLIDGLKNKTITPERILRTSGTYTLIILLNYKPVQDYCKSLLKRMEKINELSFNELMMYYTLVDSLSLDSPIGNEVREFYTKYNDLMPKIKEFLTTKIVREEISKAEHLKEIAPKQDDIKPKISAKKSTKEEIAVPVLQAIDEARQNEHKIVLVRSETFMSALTETGIALVGNSTIDYPQLNTMEIIQKILHQRKMPLMTAAVGKLEFDPPITKNDLLAIINEVLEEHKSNEITNPTTGEKMKIHRPDINPEYEDLLAIGFFFMDLVHRGRLNEDQIEIFLEAFIELSKERIIILPHPQCDLGSTFDIIKQMTGSESPVLSDSLFDKFISLAVIASEEPE